MSSFPALPAADQGESAGHPSEQPFHTHHWRIDEQSGAHSRGRCDCGAERQFQNGWDSDGGLAQGASWRSRREQRSQGTR